jgi:hypothetical protein
MRRSPVGACCPRDRSSASEPSCGLLKRRGWPSSTAAQPEPVSIGPAFAAPGSRTFVQSATEYSMWTTVGLSKLSVTNVQNRGWPLAIAQGP